MRKFISIALLALCAALALTSCETLDPDKDFSGTIYGFWVVDKLEAEAFVTINGTTTSSTSTFSFSNEYVRLNLDTSHIATLWFNLELPDMEKFNYDESAKRIEFPKGLDKGDDGKAVVLLGIYDVQLDGDNLVLSQPEASIGVGGYGVGQRSTYYLHRAPKSEKPRDVDTEK